MNKVQEIWADQAFVSSQMDGVESRLVALEKVAASFSHFIIEHWVPAQCQADVTSVYCLLYSHMDFSCLLSQQPANFRGRG